jgi:hypothetical protein
VFTKILSKILREEGNALEEVGIGGRYSEK